MARAQEPTGTTIGFRFIGDGVTPGRTPWGAVVRLPLELSVPAGQTRRINTGISFDRACLLFPTGQLVDEAGVSVKFPGALGSLLLPDTPVFIEVSCDQNGRGVNLEAKESVAYAIFPSAVDVLERKD